ncbi:LMBR1-like membrane protein like protein [Aduncisulcus paluster]|uniref:LMBR1-like membrane protein like protein n=1 Tax=Aduncisulcus paluster TaxID=2918883 RepID=A0ABQ5KJ84_9EUKA|nr:LMBR1-like membrane protein like protein [Aduncisulcus paluster]
MSSAIRHVASWPYFAYVFLLLFLSAIANGSFILDVVQAFDSGEQQTQQMVLVWTAIYIISLPLPWVKMAFDRYHESADPRFWPKFWYTVYCNVRFYALVLIPFIAVGIVFISVTSFTFMAVISAVLSFMNIWYTFFFILFFSRGVVVIPRLIFRRFNKACRTKNRIYRSRTSLKKIVGIRKTMLQFRDKCVQSIDKAGIIYRNHPLISHIIDNILPTIYSGKGSDRFKVEGCGKFDVDLLRVAPPLLSLDILPQFVLIGSKREKKEEMEDPMDVKEILATGDLHSMLSVPTGEELKKREKREAKREKLRKKAEKKASKLRAKRIKEGLPVPDEEADVIINDDEISDDVGLFERISTWLTNQIEGDTHEGNSGYDEEKERKYDGEFDNIFQDFEIEPIDYAFAASPSAVSLHFDSRDSVGRAHTRGQSHSRHSSCHSRSHSFSQFSQLKRQEEIKHQEEINSMIELDEKDEKDQGDHQIIPLTPGDVVVSQNISEKKSISGSDDHEKMSVANDDEKDSEKSVEIADSHLDESEKVASSSEVGVTSIDVMENGEEERELTPPLVSQIEPDHDSTTEETRKEVESDRKVSQSHSISGDAAPLKEDVKDSPPSLDLDLSWAIAPDQGMFSHTSMTPDNRRSAIFSRSPNPFGNAVGKSHQRSHSFNPSLKPPMSPPLIGLSAATSRDSMSMQQPGNRTCVKYRGSLRMVGSPMLQSNLKRMTSQDRESWMGHGHRRSHSLLSVQSSSRGHSREFSKYRGSLRMVGSPMLQSNLKRMTSQDRESWMGHGHRRSHSLLSVQSSSRGHSRSSSADHATRMVSMQLPQWRSSENLSSRNMSTTILPSTTAILSREEKAIAEKHVKDAIWFATKARQQMLKLTPWVARFVECVKEERKEKVFWHGRQSPEEEEEEEEYEEEVGSTSSGDDTPQDDGPKLRSVEMMLQDVAPNQGSGRSRKNSATSRGALKNLVRGVFRGNSLATELNEGDENDEGQISVIWIIVGILFSVLSIFLVYHQIIIFSPKSREYSIIHSILSLSDWPVYKGFVVLVYNLICHVYFMMGVKGLTFSPRGAHSPHASQYYSLLVHAYIICRVSPAQCWNSLNACNLSDIGTGLQRTISITNDAPVVGLGFTTYAPLMCIVFVILELVGFVEKILVRMGVAVWDGSEQELLSEAKDNTSREEQMVIRACKGGHRQLVSVGDVRQRGMAVSVMATCAREFSEDVKRRKRRMKRLKERSIRQNRAASQANMVIQSRFMYSTTREEHERNMEEKREKEKKRKRGKGC